MVQMTSIASMPNCYLGRIVPCSFHKLESFCCPSLHWQCGDYQQAFQSGHLSQTHTTMDVLLIPLGQRGNSSPWWHLVSLMYVSVFWDLDDQMMRLLHVTCPFDPDYCCHYCIFPTRYLLYPPLPLALVFEVFLAGLMLIVAALVDLVLRLTLIVATPRTSISINLKCWVVLFIKTIAIYLIIDVLCFHLIIYW